MATRSKRGPAKKKWSAVVTRFQSAMSMLNFEINRAGKGLSADRRRVLNQAKSELRRVFARPAKPAARRKKKNAAGLPRRSSQTKTA
ncbi:MAG TPA: DUF3175 domain-containing protein [Steroidobacteraceae bacterium]|nr:DUF3175 domain-containing protein [Steroidobacteraceae bacterium]